MSGSITPSPQKKGLEPLYHPSSLGHFFPSLRGADKRNGESAPNARPKNEFTRERQAYFLELCLTRGPRLAENAYLAGVCPMTERNHRKNDEEYAEAFAAMQDIWRGRVEEEVIRRGIEGYDEPVFFAGKKAGTIRKFSDNCLLALMRRYDPAYRESGAGVNIDVGAAGVLVVASPPASSEEWRERFRNSRNGKPQQGSDDRSGGGDRSQRPDPPLLPTGEAP